MFLYKKVTLHFISGNKITFLAKKFKWEYNTSTGKLTSWNAEYVINFPAYFVMDNVEIITSKDVIYPWAFIKKFF